MSTFLERLEEAGFDPGSCGECPCPDCKPFHEPLQKFQDLVLAEVYEWLTKEGERLRVLSAENEDFDERQECLALSIKCTDVIHGLSAHFTTENQHVG